MARVKVRGLTVYRAILFLPQILSMVVVGVAWRWIYAPKGPFNSGLDWLGLNHISRAWLGDFTLALPAVGLIGTWVMFGLTMINDALLQLNDAQRLQYVLVRTANDG